MPMTTGVLRLKMMQPEDYAAPCGTDPLRCYYWPVLGAMYRRRVELCLEECTGGTRVLEIGFGSGVTFLNLREKYDEIHGLDLDADVQAVASRFRARGVQTDLRRGNVRALPYPDDHFDTVLLISILEHLQPEELLPACREIARVLKPGGQMVYGVPVERPLMVWMFRLLGSNIREQHFSTQNDVARAAGTVLQHIRIQSMHGKPACLGSIYEVGHFVKNDGSSVYKRNFREIPRIC